MSDLVTVETRWIVGLSAILGNVTDAIAAITALRLLGAGTGIMTELVAFETLLTVVSASHITATAAAATSSSIGNAVAGKMARTVALVARGSHRHSACVMFMPYQLKTLQHSND